MENRSQRSRSSSETEGRGLQRAPTAGPPHGVANCGRGPARADARPAHRRRGGLYGARRLAGGRDPARLRLPLYRHHRGSGNAHRAGSRGAAGPDELRARSSSATASANGYRAGRWRAATSIVLAEGDRVPADATVVECEDLLVDESLLTGESVRRSANPPASIVTLTRTLAPAATSHQTSSAGSLVVRGGGIAEATATGALSEIGRIGQSLGTLETEPPRLQAQIDRIVRMFGLAGLRRQRSRGGALRVVARAVAGRAVWAARSRHVDAAARVPCRLGRIHGDGSIAHLARARSHAAGLRHRGAWLSDRALHRQDRHVDRE